MENKLFIFLIPLLLIFVFLIGLQTSCGNAKKSYTMKNYKIGDDYDAEWKQVQAFEQKGLTQDAKNVVEQIFAKAEKEKNAGQTIKALLHLYRYDSYTEEQSEQKVVNDLKAKIEAAEYPVKPVLQSILAQAYWQYFNNNRYQILQRTALQNDAKAPDFETWDASRFSREMTDLYMASLADTKKLKTTNINIYDAIISTRNASDDITPSSVLRPTLYDLLAHRALDYFTDDQANITKASDQFEISQTTAFADSKTFSQATFNNSDALSLPYYALLTFQQLVDLHLSRSNPAPLIDAEIKRLKFVKRKSVLDNKNELYVEALKKMYEKYKAASPSTNISYEMAAYYNELGGKYQAVAQNEMFKYDKKKAFDICEAAIAKHPDSKGAKNCKRLRSEIIAKNISFKNEENVKPNVESQVLFTYKNIEKIYGRVILLTESLEKKIKRKNRTEIAKIYANQAAIKSFEYDLPDEKLFLENKTELPVPALEVGKYVLLFSTSSKFSIEKNAITYQRFQVTNLSFLSKAKGAETTIYVRNRFSGVALSNINYTLSQTEYDYKKRKYNTKIFATGKTDTKGTFNLTTPNNGNVEIVLQDGKDTFKSNLYLNRYRNNDAKNASMTFFFTDRSIYRPGQTVFFKGLMLEKYGNKEKYELLPNKTTTVTLFDVNGQKVTEQKFKTNEYGSFNGKFSLPSGVLNGQMRIANENGNQYVSVEEYKRPKFEVTFEPIKGSYKLGETVSAEGLAKAYAGNNITDAKVTYRVVRQARFPYWCWWWRPMPTSPALEITNGTMTTDENGNFKIDFEAIADKTVDKKNKPQYTYTIYADVTDINGETRSKTTSVSVSYTALLASINMADVIDSKAATTFPIATTNLNGEFEAADIEVSITALKTPEKVFRHRLWEQPDKFVIEKSDFDKRFANDEYDAENNLENWEKGKQVFSKKIKTTKKSELEIANLNTWKAGKYLVELKTKDKFGEAVTWQKYITIYEQDADKVPTNELFWHQLSTEKADVGEYVDIFYGSAAENAQVLVEIVHHKTILKREWLDASQAQKKLRFKIEEQHRGNIGISWTMIKYNRFFSQSKMVTIPWTNKELNIELSTFRNKLLPGQDEEWQLKISGSKGEKVAAEMLAAMYDASLDAFRPHDWNFGIYRNYAYSSNSFGQSSVNGFGTNSSYLAANSWNKYHDSVYQYYDELNLFGFSLTSYGHNSYDAMQYSKRGSGRGRAMTKSVPQSMGIERSLAKEAAPASAIMMDTVGKEMEESDDAGMSLPPNDQQFKEGGFDDVQIRKNLQETAFFMPDLRTNADGEIIISFTAPEALTKWRFMALAHTKDLKYKQIEESVVTQKDLMVMPNAPRFLRENDDITISTKVSNLSEKSLSGTAVLQIFDATTMKAVDADFGNHKAEQNFSVAGQKSSALNWKLHIPGNVSAVVYRIIAKAGKFSDGEENMLPVLTNRMLVTETMPLPVRGKGEHKFTFKNLDKAEASNTLKHQSMTLEFSSHPVWYAIQALPYMMEYPHECSEQIFSRYYANSIAAHAANSSPKIKKVFDTWTAEAKILKQNKDKAAVKSALLSNLEKNQELKSLLLEETPWVRAAKNESERKQRLGLLFDLQKMTNELAVAEKKLLERQMDNGAWPWFSGMRPNRYITQHLVTGIGHLQQLGIKSDNYNMQSAMEKAVRYLDSKIHEDYKNLKKYNTDLSKNNLSNIAIHYLYARSFFPDVNFNNTHKKAFNYYLGQAQEYWVSQSKYSQGMIALAIHRLEKADRKTPADILESLRQNATYNDEMGMYFKDIRSGWFWYEAPIETQALIIEAFSEIENDKEVVDELKIWLLKQKQTQDWKTTKATAEACYALLLQGTDLLQSDEVAKVQLGNHVVHPSTMPDLKTEAGTGYYKTAWQAGDIETEMKNIVVTKTDDGVAWGAVYWQYFEQLDKITHAETPLAIKKEVFLKKNTKSGEELSALSDGAKINIGDLVRVRVEIRVDRLMEYVHLKDMRAAGFEPTNVLSRYKYQGGIGYYESTKDAATNFFIGYLPKGTYVFEYDLRASHAGDFSNGITTMQCMYAPEFTTHSEGIRVVIE